LYLQTAITYNSTHVRQNGTKEDIEKGFKLWIDIVNPTPSEISEIKEAFDLDSSAVEALTHKSKKPQIRVLDNHKFTLILDIRYKTFENLVTEGVYFFHGTEWLITVHSDKVDLLTNVQLLFEQRNRKVMEATIDALYYNILTEIISRYEQLLTSVELTISDFGQKSLQKRATKKILEQLDILTRQIILLRRHFWQARNIMNFLTHTEKNKDEVKYLQIAYDDTYQLIELVESFRDTINYTRDLYIANLSMQMNDTMRTLTIFTAILLPLTLIAGIYGMNGIDLTNIGNVPIGFMIVIVTMIGMVAFLFWFFKQKQWIMSNEDNEIEQRTEGQNPNQSVAGKLENTG
jgi:magnesium transporter